MGPPGAVDREFVYIDFVFFPFVLPLPSLFLLLSCCFFLLSSCFFRVASSFSLLASFVLLLPSLFLLLLCCFFLLSSCFCCVGSILAPKVSSKPPKVSPKPPEDPQSANVAPSWLHLGSILAHHGSILAHLKESCIVCFILVSSTAATRHHSPRAVSMLLSFFSSEIHLTKYTYFPLSYDRFLLFYVILYCFLLCFFMLDIREIQLHY